MVNSDLGTSHSLPYSQGGLQHHGQQISYFLLLGIHETVPRVWHPVLAAGWEHVESDRTSPGEPEVVKQVCEETFVDHGLFRVKKGGLWVPESRHPALLRRDMKQGT